LPVLQFLLLAVVLVFCVSAKPSSNLHGMLALVAALIAVTAMACQYALLRLALPKAISTAVMTGNHMRSVADASWGRPCKAITPQPSSRKRAVRDRDRDRRCVASIDVGLRLLACGRPDPRQRAGSARCRI